MNIAAIKARGRRRVLSASERLGIILSVQDLRVALRRFFRAVPAVVTFPAALVLQWRRPRGARTRLAWHDGGWQRCLATPDLVAHELMRSNLDVVVDAAEGAGIAHFVVPHVPPHRHLIAVAEGDRAALAQALRRSGQVLLRVALDPPPEDDEEQGRVPPRATAGVPVARLRGGAASAARWRVFVPRCDPSGRLVLAQTYGCDVEFWQESAEAPVLRAPQANPTATIVPRTQVGSGALDIGGRSFPTVSTFMRGTRADVADFPVDIVYTWVDGNDPAWRERKAATLRELDPEAHLADSATTERYEARDELRYSLRSLAMYADFVRRVYLVTDDQVPPWLDTDHPKLTVVNHQEIFDGSGKLPTFNSHAIESRLHHIDGLAEHYLYMNDDFFFGRRVQPETFFFGNGLSKFFQSPALMGMGRADSTTRSVDAAARNNRDLLARHFGRFVTQKFKHTPYAMRRSVLFEMEETFPDEFAQTASAQFRSMTDLSIVSALYHYYAYLTRRAAPAEIANRYIDLAYHGVVPRLDDAARYRDWDTLCINDSGLSGPEAGRREKALRQFLADTWPVPSEFERA